MDDSVLPTKLFSDLSETVKIVDKHGDIHIFSHYDADGISAAGILAKALLRRGKSFKLSLFTALNDTNVKTVLNSGADCVIMADMGASYISELEKFEGDVIVLDHHRSEGLSNKIHYVNPHLYNIDGMTSACGASISMLFATVMDDRNWDLVQLAFAGIAGDRQDVEILTGVNAYLFEEGSKRGYIQRTEGSMIPSGQLMKSLYYSTDPYIRGISGNAEGVSSLLADAKIDATKSSSDLTDAERRRLSSLIAVKLLNQNVQTDVMKDISGVRYIMNDRNMDAGEMASVLNSCGRLGVGGMGVGVALGDERSLAAAESVRDESREKITLAALELDLRGLEQMDNFQFFDSSTSGFTGTLCEIGMRFFGKPDKPTIGLNCSEDKVKASARCTHEILAKGVDLSIAMKTAAESVGGGGGGHRIASGAWFPTEGKNDFLKKLDSIIGEQISGAR